MRRRSVSHWKNNAEGMVTTSMTGCAFALTEFYSGLCECRWMEDRQNNITQNEAYSHTKNEISQQDRSPRTDSSRGSSNSAVVSRTDARGLANESELFNRLTDRITKQIRQDVKAEINNNINSDEVRDAVVEKMDRYLEAELHTHTCKICFGALIFIYSTDIYYLCQLTSLRLSSYIKNS